MSRSNPQLTNPATRFFEWSGSTGKIHFYDKEQEKRIDIPLPFKFMPLDQLSTIVGFSSRDNSGYWSNEVRNITSDKLIVKTKHGIAQEGLYKELADVRAKGAKYAKSIYIAYLTKQGWEIGNFKAAGSALSAWIEFTGTCVPENGKVTITKGSVLKTPKGDEYYPPEFKYESCTPAENNIAIDLDRDLQIYLKQYMINNVTDGEGRAGNKIDSNDSAAENETPPENEVGEYDEEIDALETRGKAKARATAEAIKAKSNPDPDVVIEDIGDEPINLDDIPF